MPAERETAGSAIGNGAAALDTADLHVHVPTPTPAGRMRRHHPLGRRRLCLRRRLSTVLSPRPLSGTPCLQRPPPARGPTTWSQRGAKQPPRPTRPRVRSPRFPPGRSSERSAAGETPASDRCRSGSRWSWTGGVPMRYSSSPTEASCCSRASRPTAGSGWRPVAIADCASPPPGGGGSRSGAVDDPPAASISVGPPLGFCASFSAEQTSRHRDACRPEPRFAQSTHRCGGRHPPFAAEP